jgi:hypothetical protein
VVNFGATRGGCVARGVEVVAVAGLAIVFAFFVMVELLTGELCGRFLTFLLLIVKWKVGNDGDER